MTFTWSKGQLMAMNAGAGGPGPEEERRGGGQGQGPGQASPSPAAPGSYGVPRSAEAGVTEVTVGGARVTSSQASSPPPNETST